MLTIFDMSFNRRSIRRSKKILMRNIKSTYCISTSRLIGTFTGCNGRIMAPNKIHVNIIPANISMPVFQPNFPIKKSANGPKDKAPIPVPAVTKPKINKL